MRQDLKSVYQFSRSTKLALVLALEILVSLTFIGTFLLLFIKLGKDVFEKEVFSFDQIITSFIISFRTPELNAFMMSLTNLGSEIVLVPLCFLMIIYLYRKRKKDALIFGFIVLVGAIVSLILKDFFQRPRPYFPITDVIYYSFPSGHTMNSVITYTTISYFIWRSTRNLLITFVSFSISFCLILIVGYSRIYLGVHYPSDVLAGYAAGLIWFTTAIMF
jgi:membrane-associated phospholipid phosphatase